MTAFAQTWSGAVSTTGGSATQLTSTSRWQYLRITNTTAGGVMYITTDGATQPAQGADTGWAVNAGETVVVPTRQAFWWQGFGGPGGNIDPVGLTNPTIDPPQHATSANAPNPGTAVWLVMPGGTTPTAAVEGAG